MKQALTVSLEIALLLFAVLIPAACRSVPAKAGSDECLVIIKTEITNPNGFQLGRNWILNYSGDYPSSCLGDNKGEFLTVVIKSSDVTTTSISTDVRGGFAGQKAEYTFVQPLPYEPGKIAIARFVLTDTLSRAESSPNGFMSSLGIREITGAERNDLIKKIGSDSAFASWTSP